MSKKRREARQTPFDYLLEAQGKIDNLFNFLKDNNLEKYNDFYYNDRYDISLQNNLITTNYKRFKVTVSTFDDRKGDYNFDFSTDFYNKGS